MLILLLQILLILILIAIPSLWEYYPLLIVSLLLLLLLVYLDCYKLLQLQQIITTRLASKAARGSAGKCRWYLLEETKILLILNTKNAVLFCDS